MTSFVLQGNSTTARTLTDGETAFIGQNGSLAVDGTAITSSGSVTVTLLGSLFGSSQALDHSGGGLELHIGSTGAASSGSSDTISARDLTNSTFVSNDGSLLSSSDALDLRGTGEIRIVNAGSISGASDGIVTSATDSSVRIVNHGDILGGDSGGIDHLDGTSRLVNFGTISGDEYGFDGAGQADTVRNLGSIEGGVKTLAEVDRVVNFGAIDFVNLGGGDDVYRGRGAGFAGEVNGGGGKDTLTSSRADDSFTGGGAADTFIFANHGGGDLVSDFGGHDKIDLTALGLKSFSEVVSAAEKVPGGVLLDFAEAHDLTIELEGVTKASLVAGDFII